MYASTALTVCSLACLTVPTGAVSHQEEFVAPVKSIWDMGKEIRTLLHQEAPFEFAAPGGDEPKVRDNILDMGISHLHGYYLDIDLYMFI